MDPPIAKAARALAMGDPLGALNQVALRDDAPALALRGIAMAQLGELARAKALLRRAERAFGARDAVARARCAVAEAEIALAARDLSWPVARLIARGEGRLLRLDEVESLLASDTVVVDACRHVVRDRGQVVSLARRPVLFALARALGEAWPGDVPRDALVARAFGSRYVDESHRARLRVEVGRLRRSLAGLAQISATQRGFALAPHRAQEVVVLAWPLEEEHAASSALALALGTSQRSVQRALESLATAGKVQWLGRGRARRWTAPSVPGLTTALLLPGPVG